MAPLQFRVNKLLHDLGLAPQETLMADASAIAAAVGLETPGSVLDVVNSAERALYAMDSAGSDQRTGSGLQPSEKKSKTVSFLSRLTGLEQPSNKRQKLAEAPSSSARAFSDSSVGLIGSADAPRGSDRSDLGSDISKGVKSKRGFDKGKLKADGEGGPVAVVGATLKKEQLPAASAASSSKIMGVLNGATTTELKDAFKRKAAALHPDSPTGDAKSFANLVKAFKTLVSSREAEQHGEELGSHWITTAGLLLLLLRGLGHDEWNGVLACMSDKCLKEAYDMSSGEGAQIERFLSEMPRLQATRRMLPSAARQVGFYKSTEGYKSHFEFHGLTISTFGAPCLQTALVHHGDLMLAISSMEKTFSQTQDWDRSVMLMKILQNSIPLYFQAYVPLSSTGRQEPKGIYTPFMTSLTAVLDLKTKSQAALVDSSCKFAERRQRAWALVNAARSNAEAQRSRPVKDFCETVKQAVAQEHMRRRAPAIMEVVPAKQSRRMKGNPAEKCAPQRTSRKGLAKVTVQNFNQQAQTEIGQWKTHLQEERGLSKGSAARLEVLVLRALQWLVDQEGVEQQTVSIADLLRGPELEGASVAFKYTSWLEHEQEASKAYLCNVFNALVLLAAFLWFSKWKTAEAHGCSSRSGALQALRRGWAKVKPHVSSRRFLRCDSDYALKLKDCPENFRTDMHTFEGTLTQLSFQQAGSVLTKSTATIHRRNVLSVLGWLKKFGAKYGAEFKLQLEALVPNPEAEGAQVAFSFLAWLRDDRKCSPKTEMFVLNTFKRVAKYLYKSEQPASTRCRPSEKHFGHLGVMRELWALEHQVSHRAKSAKPSSDINKKWLDWPFFLEAVERLRAECRPLTSQGKKRTPGAIAKSWQRYLLCKMMSVIPDRQRTFRELEMGRTFVQVPMSKFDQTFALEAAEMKAAGVKCEELWAIKHSSEDYKTGSTYGERPLLPFGPILSREVDEFVRKWRGQLCKGNHQFLFCRSDGLPLAERDIWFLLTQAMRRVAGKAVNPHLVRDMVVTHVRSQDVSYKQLESLALYMGHSLKQQQSTYDKRSKAQKVSPAVSLLNTIAASVRK
eukprot:s311_g23.t1